MASLAAPLPARIRALTVKRPSPDVIAVAILLILSVVATWPLLHGGMMIGQDTATFFYPIYSFVGKELASGHIPLWNPYQFSGAPCVADPESGWMYLPAMLLFAVLPLTAAAKAFLLGHLILAGLGTYALARALRMSLVGAMVAAVAYEFTGLLYGRSVCCPAYLQVIAWVPVIILGAELAIHSRSWLTRACWWAATGFCVSQVLAAWLGQGSYYVLLALGGYVFYRTVITPPPFARAGRARLAGLAVHGGAVLAFGFALAAAGILPRLEYNALTNLANGYQGDMSWAASLGGWSAKTMVKDLLGRTLYYAGGATVALALIGLLIARGRYATPYFALLSAAALLLAAKRTTPLHRLFYALLPRFEELHQHWPERIMVVFYLGLALLAGAAVSALAGWQRRGRPEVLVFVSGLPALGLLLLKSHGAEIPRPTVEAVVAAGLFVAAYALLPRPVIRRALPALLLLVVFVDLRAAGRDIVTHGLYGGFYKVNLDAYYDPGGAGRFLQAEQETTDQPFRYFGYDPSLFSVDQGQASLYRYQFIDPEPRHLLVNNRATILGLQDVQGYNPVQLERYVEYIDALNGRSQEYHGSYVLPTGLNSPLLNLLNARFVVIPTAIPANRPDLQSLRGSYPTVYRDDRVTVLENPNAFPRAWLVHGARRVDPGRALDLLRTGAVDPWQTALLERALPPLAQPADPSTDRATVVGYDPDRIHVSTHSDAPAILMLSEVAYPGWHAYVDGKPVPVYEADHILRGIPVPAGTHAIDVRFESRTLREGLAISLAAYAVLLGLLVVAAWRRLRRAAPIV